MLTLVALRELLLLTQLMTRRMPVKNESQVRKTVT